MSAAPLVDTVCCPAWHTLRDSNALFVGESLLAPLVVHLVTLGGILLSALLARRQLTRDATHGRLTLLFLASGRAGPRRTLTTVNARPPGGAPAGVTGLFFAHRDALVRPRRILVGARSSAVRPGGVRRAVVPGVLSHRFGTPPHGLGRSRWASGAHRQRLNHWKVGRTPRRCRGLQAEHPGLC